MKTPKEFLEEFPSFKRNDDECMYKDDVIVALNQYVKRYFKELLNYQYQIDTSVDIPKMHERSIDRTYEYSTQHQQTIPHDFLKDVAKAYAAGYIQSFLDLKKIK